MSRLILSFFAYVCTLVAFALSLTACSDEIPDHTPCKNVTCEANAVCDPNVNACVCRQGFEDQDGECVKIVVPECTQDSDCDDGLLCNGTETCDQNTGTCHAGTDIVTCGTNEVCAEPDADCVCARFHIDVEGECLPIQCENDADCDDGLRCNGLETCNLDTQQCEDGTPVQCTETNYYGCTESDHERGFSCDVIPPKGTTACGLLQTTDWGTTGMLAILNLETGEILDDITSYAQDAALRVVNDEVYVLERHMYDAVLKLDAYDNYETAWNHSIKLMDLGVDVPNPWDMVAWGDYFFLSLYNDGRILRVNANPDPFDLTSFLGDPIFTRRIDPPAWDAPFAELAFLRTDGDILFALTQGLDEAWNCGTDENRGRIYAFNLPDLTDANIFADGTNYLTLEHCNPGGWVDLPDGRILVHSLGDYRSIQGTGDDGGLQLFDIHNRTLGPVVATEDDIADEDIFEVQRVQDRIFALTVGLNFGELTVTELFPTEDDSPWGVANEPLFTDGIWSTFGYKNIFYATVRAGGESLARINIDTMEEILPRIDTKYPPEHITLFFRDGDSCW